MGCKSIVLIVLPLFLLIPDHATWAAGKSEQAASEKPASSVQKSGKTKPLHNTKRIIYKPPSRGAPAARVGAGTRGVEEGSEPELYALTPDHTGYTSRPQPTLYWYLSRAVSARLDVVLINDSDIEPILEITFDSEKYKGIHPFNLADYGIHLKPGITYQWFVALVMDSEQRSSDRIASGRIKYVPLSGQKKATLDATSGAEVMWFFANEGYWYDLYDRLSYLMARQPDNQELLNQQAALLQQVGFQEWVER